MKLTLIMYQMELFIYKTNLLKLKIQNEVLRNRILWIVMIFCCFAVNIKENIKNAAEPQKLTRQDNIFQLSDWAQ